MEVLEVDRRGQGRLIVSCAVGNDVAWPAGAPRLDLAAQGAAELHGR